MSHTDARYRFEEISPLITFLYKGEVKVPRENLEEFMETAQDLEIKGLLESDIDTESALEEYSVSDVINTNPKYTLMLIIKKKIINMMYP